MHKSVYSMDGGGFVPTGFEEGGILYSAVKTSEVG